MTANTTHVPEVVMTTDGRAWNETGKHHVMTCVWGQFKHQFQIISITDTTWYLPGMWLSIEVINQINNRKHWTVTMIHDDLIKNILTGIANHISLPTVTVPTVL